MVDVYRVMECFVIVLPEIEKQLFMRQIESENA